MYYDTLDSELYNLRDIDLGKVVYYNPSITVDVFKPADSGFGLVLVYTYDLINTDTFSTELDGDDIIATSLIDTEYLFAFYVQGEIHKFYINVPKDLELELPMDLIKDKQSFKLAVCMALANYLPHRDLTATVIKELSTV